MSENNSDEKDILPHHEQQELCTTRLPYRQGRKLTAVKVYTINSESNHLLIFGIPALNLRQEAKALFLKFGRLKSFNLAKQYKCEQFTETYHAVFDKIQSARMAKKMLDTKTFYGGSIHITYAPELEDLDETNSKLLQRKHDVLARLRNLQKEQPEEKNAKTIAVDVVEAVTPKINMGESNIIHHDGTVRKRKHKDEEQFKPCFIENEVKSSEIYVMEQDSEQKRLKFKRNDLHSENTNVSNKTQYVDRRSSNIHTTEDTHIEIVDCTSTDIETITNVDEHSSPNKNDGIKIYKVPYKPLNKIKFNVNKKKNL